MSRDIDDLRRPEQAQCDEHDRCLERDKAECEWCQHPAVAHPAQQYEWRKDLQEIKEALICHQRLCSGPDCFYEFNHISTYLERLEAERDALQAENEYLAQ